MPTNALEKARPARVGGVGHVGARREVGRVVVHPGQGVEDQPGRLHAERVGVGRGEDRHRRLERVGERVDAAVDGHRLAACDSVSIGSTIAMSGTSE